MERYYNPRYAAYAREHGRTPKEQSAQDEIDWPGGCMVGFMLWFRQKFISLGYRDCQHYTTSKWEEWYLNTHRRKTEPCPTYHDIIDAALGVTDADCRHEVVDQ